jgi:hypothetical protein
MAELTVTRRVPVPAELAWSLLLDWSRQREWVLGTRVWVVDGDGASVGSRIVAFTGVGDVGLVDTMEITEWQPPLRCRVRHTGRLVRGAGVFQVRPGGQDNTCVVGWTEQLDLPLGRLGELGWRVLRPAFAAGVRLCLRRFDALARAQAVRTAAGGSGHGNDQEDQ